MVPRYIVRTVDQDWIDELDGPTIIDGKRPAWDEAQRRVRAYPDMMTVVINRNTGSILWQSDPDISDRYEVVSFHPNRQYSTDPDVDYPIQVLSSHKDKDDAWTAFYAAVASAQPDGNIIEMRHTEPGLPAIANSNDYNHLRTTD